AMTHTLATVLLALCLLAGLVLVPLGLPGLWVMVAGVAGYGWLTDFRSVGVPTIALVLGPALVGEIAETWLGFRLARRAGRRSRDLAHLLQEAERQAAHPVQPRRGRSAVLRLDRQPPQADRRGSLCPALLAAPPHEPPLRHEPRARAPADRLGPHDQVRPGKH